MANKNNEIYNRVKSILTDYPEARDSDKYLFRAICWKYYGVSKNDAFFDVLKRDDIPPLETFSRTRRKIQHDYPELRASKEVQVWRLNEQTRFLEFARS